MKNLIFIFTMCLDIIINMFSDLLDELKTINKNFYQNIEYIYNDKRNDKLKILYVESKIINICIEMNIMIGKFNYNLNQKSGTLPIYKTRDLEKYPFIQGYDIEDLKKYINKINFDIKRFNFEIFNLSIYQDIDNSTHSLKKSNISSEYQVQFLKDLLIKLETFLNSENSNLFLQISDALYDCKKDIKESLKKISDAHSEKIQIGEKYMTMIRKYLFLINNVSVEDVFTLESVINSYIWINNL